MRRARKSVRGFSLYAEGQWSEAVFTLRGNGRKPAVSNATGERGNGSSRDRCGARGLDPVRRLRGIGFIAALEGVRDQHPGRSCNAVCDAAGKELSGRHGAGQIIAAGQLEKPQELKESAIQTVFKLIEFRRRLQNTVGNSPAVLQIVHPSRDVRLHVTFVKGRRERAEGTASKGQDRGSGRGRRGRYRSLTGSRPV